MNNRIPPPVIPDRWLRIHRDQSEEFAAVAARIRDEVDKHPAHSTCDCPAIAAVEAFAAIGYEVVPVEAAFAETRRLHIRPVEAGADSVDVAIADALNDVRRRLLPWEEA